MNRFIVKLAVLAIVGLALGAGPALAGFTWNGEIGVCAFIDPNTKVMTGEDTEFELNESENIWLKAYVDDSGGPTTLKVKAVNEYGISDFSQEFLLSPEAGKPWNSVPIWWGTKLTTGKFTTEYQIKDCSGVFNPVQRTVNGQVQYARKSFSVVNTTGAPSYIYSGQTGLCNSITVDKVRSGETKNFTTDEKVYHWIVVDILSATTMRLVYTDQKGYDYPKEDFYFTPSILQWKNSLVYKDNMPGAGSWSSRWQVKKADGNYKDIDGSSASYTVTQGTNPPQASGNYATSSQNCGINQIQAFDNAGKVTDTKQLVLEENWHIVTVKKLKNGNFRVTGKNPVAHTLGFANYDCNYNLIGKWTKYPAYVDYSLTGLPIYYEPMDDVIYDDGSGIFLFDFAGYSYMVFHDTYGNFTDYHCIGYYGTDLKAVSYSKIDNEGRLLIANTNGFAAIAELTSVDTYINHYMLPIPGNTTPLTYAEYGDGSKNIMYRLNDSPHLAVIEYYGSDNVKKGDMPFLLDSGWTYRAFGHF